MAIPQTTTLSLLLLLFSPCNYLIGYTIALYHSPTATTYDANDPENFANLILDGKHGEALPHLRFQENRPGYSKLVFDLVNGSYAPSKYTGKIPTADLSTTFVKKVESLTQQTKDTALLEAMCATAEILFNVDSETKMPVIRDIGHPLAPLTIGGLRKVFLRQKDGTYKEEDVTESPIELVTKILSNTDVHTQPGKTLQTLYDLIQASHQRQSMYTGETNT